MEEKQVYFKQQKRNYWINIVSTSLNTDFKLFFWSAKSSNLSSSYE